MIRAAFLSLAMLLAPAAHAAQAAPGREVAAAFETDRLNAHVLSLEAALARAQARHGVIPQSAADAITQAAIPENLPADALAGEYDRVRHRMVALLNVLRRSLDEEAGNYLHYGATTVDLYDSARMLQLREATLAFIADLRAIELELIALAQAHRDTPMIGRTLGQHALPITFGKKVSVWIGENRRHIDRLTDLLGRIERSVIMKGAVGSYLGLGPEAMAVERSLAAELGLPAPYEDDWHASRDVFAEYAAVLGLISRSWGRFGQEVFLLQSTDIAELVETRPASAVGSSAMPHKNNPSLSEALMMSARIVPRQAEIVGDDMINFFERDNTSRPNAQLEAVSVELEAQLRDASRLIARLEIDTARMRANLDRTQGWILSQRVVFALAPVMGREHAETRLRELAAEARESGAGLREALETDPEIMAALPADELDALLDPATYLGLAAEQTDAVIAAARAARESDPL